MALHPGNHDSIQRCQQQCHAQACGEAHPVDSPRIRIRFHGHRVALELARVLIDKDNLNITQSDRGGEKGWSRHQDPSDGEFLARTRRFFSFRNSNLCGMVERWVNDAKRVNVPCSSCFSMI